MNISPEPLDVILKLLYVYVYPLGGNLFTFVQFSNVQIDVGNGVI